MCMFHRVQFVNKGQRLSGQLKSFMNTKTRLMLCNDNIKVTLLKYVWQIGFYVYVFSRTGPDSEKCSVSCQAHLPL